MYTEETRTERGFIVRRFKDIYNKECSIQESSLATEDAIWMGAGSERMHLNQAMVADLIPQLQHFVQYGTLPRPEAAEVKESDPLPTAPCLTCGKPLLFTERYLWDRKGPYCKDDYFEAQKLAAKSGSKTGGLV